MPELPEVETVKNGLAPHMEGKRLKDIVLNRPNLRFPFKDGFASALKGARVLRLYRRAKYLVAETDREQYLIMHLGMSGRFTIQTPTDLAIKPGDFTHAIGTNPKHDHVVFTTEEDVKITFNDPRRFGYMLLEDMPTNYFEAVGPEPLGNQFSGPVLTQSLKGKRSPIKTALLDQSIVAGLGNIYVCEALHRARISPQRLAANMGAKRCDRLVPIIRDVLSEAIEAGGSTLRDYAHTDGSLGYFQHRFHVYGRENEPCNQCRKPITRTTQSGRSTFWCTTCQR